MFDEDIKPAEYAEIEIRGRLQRKKALMTLFGKCMRELKGNCDPQVLRELLIKKIYE